MATYCVLVTLYLLFQVSLTIAKALKKKKQASINEKLYRVQLLKWTGFLHMARKHIKRLKIFMLNYTLYKEVIVYNIHKHSNSTNFLLITSPNTKFQLALIVGSSWEQEKCIWRQEPSGIYFKIPCLPWKMFTQKSGDLVPIIPLNLGSNFELCAANILVTMIKMSYFYI